MATTTVAGSVAAKEAGLALAQIYNYIRTGKVKNHKVGGWPEGKGIEVEMTEVLAARDAAQSRRSGKAPRAPRQSKADRQEAQATMHEALDDEERTRRARKRASGEDGNTVRLHRMDRTARHPVCPVNPAHGEVAPAERDAKAKGVLKFHCWHQEHDGRPKGHPGGFAPQTQSTFTEDELQTPQPVGALGVIMLGWITTGRTDLSESLESWMTKNKLPVWIPAR